MVFFPKIKQNIKNLGYCIGNEYSGLKASFFSMKNLFINNKIMPLWRHKIMQEIGIAKLAGLEISEKLIPLEKIKSNKVNNFLKKIK